MLIHIYATVPYLSYFLPKGKKEKKIRIESEGISKYSNY
jgi:hypothetical protein